MDFCECTKFEIIVNNFLERKKKNTLGCGNYITLGTREETNANTLRLYTKLVVREFFLVQHIISQSTIYLQKRKLIDEERLNTKFNLIISFLSIYVPIEFQSDI